MRMNRKTCSALFYKACEALPGSAGYEQFSAMGDALSPPAQDLLEKEKEHLTRLQLMDRELLTKGCGLVAGVDEAGRGPLAGPVIAAAAAFRELPFLPFVNDSKLLGHDERETLLAWIEKTCHIGIGQASHEEIDLLNIHRASLLAMARAVEALPVRPGFLLIDGRFVIPGLSMPQKSIIKGDRTSFSIACASIAAKVTRDRIMEDLHLQYPHYGFARHMGYPTQEHCKALEIYGPCAVHRKSYGPVRACLAGMVQDEG